MELRTATLVLREFTPDDVAAVHEYASDPVVCQDVEWGPNSPGDTRRVVAFWVAEQAQEDRDGWTLAITERGGRPMGAVSLNRRSPHTAEIGYVLAQPYWGRGLGTEAAGAAVRWAFGEGGFHRVQATCRPENVASWRVMEKVGLAREGLLRDHLLIRGRYRDSYLYAVLSIDRAGQPAHAEGSEPGSG